MTLTPDQQTSSTRVAEVEGSIPGPAIYFHRYSINMHNLLFLRHNVEITVEAHSFSELKFRCFLNQIHFR